MQTKKICCNIVMDSSEILKAKVAMWKNGTKQILKCTDQSKILAKFAINHSF